MNDLTTSLYATDGLSPGGLQQLEDRISVDRFHTWIDRYFMWLEQRGAPRPVAALIPGVSLFVIGFAIALSYDFQGVYLVTPPIYLGAFGTTLVLASMRWASISLRKRLIEIRPCFAVEDLVYEKKLERWLNTYSNDRIVIPFSATIVCVALILALLAINLGPSLQLMGLKSLRPSLFPPPWYSGDIPRNMLIVSIFAVGCGLPLGTSIWAFFINVPFLYDLKRLPTIPVPVVLLIKFRSFTNFYLITSFTWYIGVSLFGFLFFRDLDLFAAVVIVGLSMLGLSVFVYPQFVFHGFLVDAYDQVADGVVSTYRKNFGFKTLRDIANDPEASDEFDRFSDMVELSEPGQLWVYDLNDVFVLVLGQAIALAVVYFQGAFN